MNNETIIESPAKLNLSLNIMGKNQNGLHKLFSIIVFISLKDYIKISPSKKNKIKVIGPMSKKLSDFGGESLLKKTLHACQTYNFTKQNYSIELTKNIPVCAGLGGGSSNAAALLKYIYNKNKISDEKKLFVIANKLGSDVSACLLSQPLYLFDDGSSFQKIQRSKLKSSELYQPGFLLINSNKPLRTKDVFDNFNISSKSKASNQKSLPLNSLNDYLKVISLGNDLIYSANTLSPEISIILGRLKKISGCLGQTMSGSGGTCFGLFKSIKKAKQMHQFIIDNCLFENYWIWSGGIVEN